jgi:hypothetical protein
MGSLHGKNKENIQRMLPLIFLSLASIAYLCPSESIVRAGSVGQRRGLFTKKRYLILTDKPRLLYLDEGRGPDGSGGTLRNEIDWSPKLLPELKGSTAFSISTVRPHYQWRKPFTYPIFLLRNSPINHIPLMSRRAKLKIGSMPSIPS